MPPDAIQRAIFVERPVERPLYPTAELALGITRTESAVGIPATEVIHSPSDRKDRKRPRRVL